MDDFRRLDTHQREYKGVISPRLDGLVFLTFWPKQHWPFAVRRGYRMVKMDIFKNVQIENLTTAIS